jgi:hypothetical protein
MSAVDIAVALVLADDDEEDTVTLTGHGEARIDDTREEPKEPIVTVEDDDDNDDEYGFTSNESKSVIVRRKRYLRRQILDSGDFEREKRIWAAADNIILDGTKRIKDKKTQLENLLRAYPEIFDDIVISSFYDDLRDRNTSYPVFDRKIIILKNVKNIRGHIFFLYNFVILVKDRLACVTYDGRVLWNLDLSLILKDTFKVILRYIELVDQLCLTCFYFDRPTAHIHVDMKTQSIVEYTYCNNIDHPGSLSLFFINRSHERNEQDNAYISLKYRCSPSITALNFLGFAITRIIPTLDIHSLLSY